MNGGAAEARRGSPRVVHGARERGRAGQPRAVRVRWRATAAHLRERLTTSWWAVPTACVLGAVGLSTVTEAVDRHIPQDETAWYLFKGGPDGARELLGTVATSMLTFTGLVFSVTVLVLQLASSQYSPRVLRSFLRDRVSQAALGTFVGTFVFALLGLRTVRGNFDRIEAHVPSFTIWVGVVLAFSCVLVFVFYIHHIAQSIRAANIMNRIAEEARRSIDRVYAAGPGCERPEEAARRPAGAPSLLVMNVEPPGVVLHVDEDALFELACAADATIVLAVRPGDFVAHGSVLAEVWGGAAELDVHAVTRSLVFAAERSNRSDVAFGVRELVDIAERALSTGVNDPTTAVQAIDQIHDLLRRLARRPFPSPCREDEGGVLRLVCPRVSWDNYVSLAFDEIRHAGAGSIQVVRRVRHALEDLLAIVPEVRAGAVREQWRLVEQAAERGLPTKRDRVTALVASPQGHGPGG